MAWIVSPQKVCWNSNPHCLGMWPYTGEWAKIRSLGTLLNMTGVLIKMRNTAMDMNTENTIWRWGQTWVMRLEVQEHRVTSYTRSWGWGKAWTGFSLTASEGTDLPTPALGLLPPGLWDNQFLLFKATQVMMLCCSHPRKWQRASRYLVLCCSSTECCRRHIYFQVGRPCLCCLTILSYWLGTQ